MIFIEIKWISHRTSDLKPYNRVSSPLSKLLYNLVGAFYK